MTEIKQKIPDSRAPDKPYKQADYNEFVRFYVLPSVFRQEEYEIRTEGEFAKKFNLNKDTLTSWKQRDVFQKDVDKQIRKWGSDKTPDVIAALYRTILQDGKAAEVKLWLQFIKNWKEGMVLDTNIYEKTNPLMDILDNLDESTRNKILNQLRERQDKR